MNAQRLLPLSGILFVALVLVPVFALGGTDTPGSDASPGEVLAFYDAHTVQQGVSAFLLAASVPFLVLFGCALATSRPPTGTTTPLAERLLVAGTALAAAMWTLTAFVHFTLASGADEGVSATALQAINALDGNIWLAFNTGLGVMMLGAAGCLWRHVGAERWLGRVALVLGILLFIPFADFFALLLTGIWIVVVGLVRSRAPRAVNVATPVPVG